MNYFLNTFLKYILLLLSFTTILTTTTEETTNQTESSLKFLSSLTESPKNLQFLSSTAKEIAYIDGKTGFNSYTNTFATSECYNLSRENLGSMKAEGTMSSSLKRREFYDSLKLSGGINIGIGAFGIGADFSLENTFSENSNISSHYYYLKFTRTRFFKYDPFIENVLTPSGMKLYQSALEKKSQKFYNFCGDSLVRSVEEGGIIIIQIKIEFESEYKKNTYDTKVTAKMGDIVSIGASVYSNLEKYKLEGKMTFKGVQLGGDAAQFEALFPKNTNEKCANAVDPRMKKENPKAFQECTEFLNDISTYIRENFPAQFPAGNSNPERYYAFKFDKSVIEGLDLPEFDDENKELNLLKNKYDNFKKVNDYYLSSMNSFKESYIYFSVLDKNFSNKFMDYLKIISENDLNLKENVFGVFRFNDCWADTRKCTKENFDKAYFSLKNIFKDIDNHMLEMKYVWDYFIHLPQCSIGLAGGEISIRIYPQANKKYGIMYVKSNLNNTAVFPRGWDWIEGKVSSPNRFEFQVHPNIRHSRAVVTPLEGENSLRVNVLCGTSIENRGSRVDNPNYFNPRILQDY